MIDIVTVVFREELLALEIQAQSLSINANQDDVGTIFIAINDDEVSHTDIDLNWWGDLSSKVKIIHRSQLYPTWGNNNGWVTQQILKLLVAARANSKWTMALDAKTWLVKPLDLGSIIVDDKIYSGIHDIMPVFRPSGREVSKLFGKSVTRIAGPSGVPFFFISNLVNELIQYIEHTQQQDFASWFESKGLVTEFILYSGFLECCHGGLENFYHLDGYLPAENICHSQVPMADEKLASIENNDNITVSIHRTAWNKLKSEHKARYIKFLQSKHITKAKLLWTH